MIVIFLPICSYFFTKIFIVRFWIFFCLQVHLLFCFIELYSNTFRYIYYHFVLSKGGHANPEPIDDHRVLGELIFWNSFISLLGSYNRTCIEYTPPPLWSSRQNLFFFFLYLSTFQLFMKLTTTFFKSWTTLNIEGFLQNHSVDVEWTWGGVLYYRTTHGAINWKPISKFG